MKTRNLSCCILREAADGRRSGFRAMHPMSSGEVKEGKFTTEDTESTEEGRCRAAREDGQVLRALCALCGESFGRAGDSCGNRAMHPMSSGGSLGEDGHRAQRKASGLSWP